MTLGRVIEKTMPKSTKKAIMTVISVGIEKLSININAVIISADSMKLKITMKIVEIIIPAFHTHFFILNVSYAKIKNILPKTNITIVRKKVPKNNIGRKKDSSECDCVKAYKTSSNE